MQKRWSKTNIAEEGPKDTSDNSNLCAPYKGGSFDTNDPVERKPNVDAMVCQSSRKTGNTTVQDISEEL